MHNAYHNGFQSLGDIFYTHLSTKGVSHISHGATVHGRRFGSLFEEFMLSSQTSLLDFITILCELGVCGTWCLQWGGAWCLESAARWPLTGPWIPPCLTMPTIDTSLSTLPVCLHCHSGWKLESQAFLDMGLIPAFSGIILYWDPAMPIRGVGVELFIWWGAFYQQPSLPTS